MSDSRSHVAITPAIALFDDLGLALSSQLLRPVYLCAAECIVFGPRVAGLNLARRTCVLARGFLVRRDADWCKLAHNSPRVASLRRRAAGHSSDASSSPPLQIDADSRGFGARRAAPFSAPDGAIVGTSKAHCFGDCWTSNADAALCVLAAERQTVRRSEPSLERCYRFRVARLTQSEKCVGPMRGLSPGVRL